MHGTAEGLRIQIGCFNEIGILGGGFKYCLFSPLFGEDSQFDDHIFQRGGSTTTSICLGGQFLIDSSCEDYFNWCKRVIVKTSCLEQQIILV